MQVGNKKEHRIKKLHDELSEKMNKRLDNIEEFINKELKRQDSRAKDFLGFIMREVKVDIGNKLFNSQVTMEAIVEVLAENGLKIDNLNEKIDAKKVEIADKKMKEAEQKMKEAQEAAQAKAAQPQDEANANEQQV